MMAGVSLSPAAMIEEPLRRGRLKRRRGAVSWAAVLAGVRCLEKIS